MTSDSKRREKANEIIGSFTGFDEIAIEKFFGKDFGRLNATMTMRSMAFITLRREGQDDTSAFKACMQMKLSEVRDYLDAEIGDDDGDQDKDENQGN